MEKKKYCCEWQKNQGTLTVSIDGKCKCGHQYPIRGIPNLNNEEVERKLNKIFDEVLGDTILFELPPTVTKVEGTVRKMGNDIMFFEGKYVPRKHLISQIVNKLYPLYPEQDIATLNNEEVGKDIDTKIREDFSNFVDTKYGEVLIEELVEKYEDIIKTTGLLPSKEFFAQDILNLLKFSQEEYKKRVVGEIEKLKVKKLFIGETQYRFYKGDVSWVFNQALDEIINILNKENE